MDYDSTNWRTDKIVPFAEVPAKARALKVKGKRIVTVNGSFDLLHAGHLDQLEEAKRQGDVLFVGINSDASVREGKGGDRPYVPDQLRASLVAALECVDYVTIVDTAYDEVPRRLITTVKPDVHVNGPDYGDPQTWVEWSAMQAVGAVGYTAARRNDFSSTDLIQKIKASDV